MIAIIIPAIILASPPPIPPVAELPDGLELCVVKAELCVAAASLDICGPPAQSELDACIGSYETCSYEYPEAHEPNCRVMHAWCVLEHITWDKEWIEFCEDIGFLCPTI